MFAAIWNFFAFISEFSCIADAELESACAAIVFVVSDWNAVIKAKRPDWEVQSEAESPVVVEMVQVGIVIGTAFDIADVVKGREPDADTALLVLLKDRNAVLGIAKPIGVPANRFGKSVFARADAAVPEATQSVEAAQIITLIKRHFARAET